MVKKRTLRKLYGLWLIFCASLFLLSLHSCALTVSLRPSKTFEIWLDSALNSKSDSIYPRGDTYNYFNNL